MSPERPVLVVALLVALASVAPVAAGAPIATADSGSSGRQPVVPPVSPPAVDPVPDRPGVRPGVAGSGIQSTEATRPAENASTAVTQTVVYSQLPEQPGEIRMRTRYRVGSNVSDVVVYDYEDAWVVDAEGFTQRQNGRWRWDGTTANATVTWQVAVNRSGRTFEGLAWVDTGRWALAHPQTGFAAYHGGNERWLYSWRHTTRLDRQTRVDGEGYASDSVVYLGEHETRQANLSEGVIRVVRPAAAADTDVETAVGAVRNASRGLRVGAKNRTVTVFLGPDPLRTGGLTVQGEDHVDMWISAGSPVEAPENVWLHEYVHARQTFRLGPRMQWFHEASASYYEGVLSVRHAGGRTAYERFQRRLHANDSAGVVLADADTWESRYSPYTRGQRVLAALDTRIRNETGNNHTLQAVFRRMNEREDVITYPRFRRIVSDVAGRPQGNWLDTHVAGPNPVSPSENPYDYTSTDPAADADGDGVTNRAERRNGTHPFDPDTDDDGVADGEEGTDGGNPHDGETDENGGSDGEGQHADADPPAAETDGNGTDDETDADTGEPDSDGEAVENPREDGGRLQVDAVAGPEAESVADAVTDVVADVSRLADALRAAVSRPGSPDSRA